MKFSVLTVNWNTRKKVEACVASIIQYPPPTEFEVIVVDNASTDGSVKNLQEKFGKSPQVKILPQARNLGFARGNNVAYEHASGELVLLLNSDTEVLPDALANMVRYMDQVPKCGILGPRILNPDHTLQPSVRRFPRFWSSLLVFSGLHRFIRPKGYFMDNFDYNEEADVDQVMGAALLTRREIVERLGLLDENFYLWYEEVDFCRRVKNAGWRIIYFPEAQVVHYGAQSFSQLRVWQRKKIVAKSLLYYFKKNGSKLQYLTFKLVLPLVLAAAWLVDRLGNLLGVRKQINK